MVAGTIEEDVSVQRMARAHGLAAAARLARSPSLVDLADMAGTLAEWILTGEVGGLEAFDEVARARLEEHLREVPPVREFGGDAREAALESGRRRRRERRAVKVAQAAARHADEDNRRQAAL